MTILNMNGLLFLALAGLLLAFLFIILIAAAVCLIRCPPHTFYKKRAAEADFCPLGRIPPRYVHMLLLSEDEFFRDHKGISLTELRIAIQINWHRGKMFAGGSTLTQQLVKNMYLDFDRNILRKLVEMVLAIAIEKVYSKDTILELYMNIVYFGCGQYGITAASAYYFNKKPETLTVNQMYMLVRILHAPTANNPLRYPEKYVISRNRGVRYWLDHKENSLTKEEAEVILSYPAEIIDPELRKATDERERFSLIPMCNERFGPHAR